MSGYSPQPASPHGQNPLADSMNPYAAPRQESGYLPGSPIGPLPPLAGLWRQGNLLVMHKAAPLPDICRLSNQPAKRRLKRSLSWHHPAVYLLVLLHLLIYIVVALIIRKTATIHIPLSDEWFAIRQRRMIFSWSAILLSVVMFAVAVSVVDQQAWAPFEIILSIFLGLGAAIYGLLACRLIVPTRITDKYVWIKGVHPDFLNRLEVWMWNI